MSQHLGHRPVLGTAEFNGFRTLVKRAAGIHLSEAKHDLVTARLAKRLRALGLSSYREYYELVRRQDPDGSELREMVNCITTNKTGFFREPHHFDTLREMLEAAGSGGAPLRIWSAGCSTGEEPYTIALTALAALRSRPTRRVEILASDIDTNVLSVAQLGIYGEGSLEDVPEELRSLGFLRGVGSQTGKMRVRPEVRSLVRFQPFNLNDPGAWQGLERFDAIFCRNVVIYFDGPTRTQLLERFAACLKPGGLLFLGHSEGLHAQQSLFETVGRTVFRRRSGTSAGGGGTPLSSAEPEVATHTYGRSVPPAGLGVTTSAHAPAEQVLTVGGVAAARGPAWIRTLLGSCVAVCLFDPEAGVGGMNHFLLPEGRGSDGTSSRYGVNAMERLIEEVVRKGGVRHRLRAKLFGAASVTGFDVEVSVPDMNAAFARGFLADRGIPVTAEQMGGRQPLEVRMQASTGRVFVRRVGIDRARLSLQAELRYSRECRDDRAAATNPTCAGRSVRAGHECA